MGIVKIFYDLETTGLDERKHGIHHLSGLIEVNGLVVEAFDFKVAPNVLAKIEPAALRVGGVTEDQIKAYPEMGTVFKKFIKLIGKYVDNYDPDSKAFLVGFNNRAFDDNFLAAWFIQNYNNYFMSYFWSGSLDVMVQATEYLLTRRVAMPSFKLKRVALELGIEVDPTKLHDAEYDVYLTRQIYRIVTGREVEI